MITVANAVKTPDILGIDSICSGGGGQQNMPYSIPTRPGATYLWSVTNGTIDTGQGTGNVTIDFTATGNSVVTVKETINCGCNWVLISECGVNGEPSYYWCRQGTDISYIRNRALEDVLQLFIDQLCPTLGIIRSDFFEINPPGDAPGYVSGENYVTGTTNKVNYLLLAQKSDIIDPTSTEPAKKHL